MIIIVKVCGKHANSCLSYIRMKQLRPRTHGFFIESSHKNLGEIVLEVHRIITIICTTSNTKYHKNDVVASYISSIIRQLLHSTGKVK